ncbi:UNVERIFIED_CONTAM: hypothetical protein Scaly_2549800 [Sesamum calycinum]|uniref:Reverse transcriptase RNase H-like domain-containing protein n=1 Tax=Sesamum calycinum TaxID=2727403 RepID=A0AAW2J0G5_9LAMI
MNMEDKKDMQMIIKEHINLGLIEPRISAYSSSGFLVRNHGEIKRGIFIKDLATYRKNFWPLLKETESAKWKWEEIHTQRVRVLKQVCNNLSKLAILQDEDELVVYTDANDYRWPVVLMKMTTTGKDPCRYTGGLFTEQQAQVWHINKKEFFVRADSSTACTRPLQNSSVTAINESQRIQTFDDSSQLSTSRVKEEEISLRPMTDTSMANTNELSSSSSSTWQRPDMVTFNRIKAASEEAPLVSAISEDDISTRRA